MNKYTFLESLTLEETKQIFYQLHTDEEIKELNAKNTKKAIGNKTPVISKRYRAIRAYLGLPLETIEDLNG